MNIQSDRFGNIEANEPDIIVFSEGIFGFADEHKFVLVRTQNAHAIGWLQSVESAYLALPVVSAHVLVPRYPDVDMEAYARVAGIGDSLDEIAVLVVLNAPPGIPATVNLVAPIFVNVATRKGAQLFLDDTRFTNRETIVLPLRHVNAPQTQDNAAANAAQ